MSSRLFSAVVNFSLFEEMYGVRYGKRTVRYGTVRVRQNFKSTVRYGTAKTAYGRTLVIWKCFYNQTLIFRTKTIVDVKKVVAFALGGISVLAVVLCIIASGFVILTQKSPSTTTCMNFFLILIESKKQSKYQFTFHFPL